MIIYNTTWLHNLQVHGQAEMAQHTGAITVAEVHQIKQEYPVGFYKPNIFVRACLFVLTCIIAVFSSVLLGLLVIGAQLFLNAALSLIFGIIVYIVLELMTRHNNYYRAGVDDALLWISGAYFAGAYVWYAEDAAHQHYELMGCIYIGMISLVLTLRFTNAVMGAVCGLAWLGMIFFGWQRLGTLGMATLPFILMLAAGLLYMGCRRLEKYPQARLYGACLTVVQTISLLALYAAGNYYLIDVLQAKLTGDTAKSHTVTFGFFFWIWTICIPFAYIAWGLIKKQALPLRAGVLLVAAAAATFRNYYHLLPPEWALTLAGAALLTVVYTVIHYLKVPKHGITYAEHYTRSSIEKLNAEALISAGISGHVADAPVVTPSRFSGGSFGGGGSSSGF